MGDFGEKGSNPFTKDFYEMQKEAEERVRRIQQQTRRAAEQLNEELTAERTEPRARTGKHSSPESPSSELLPLPVRKSVSYGVSEDLKRYRVLYRDGFLGRNYPEAFEDDEEEEAELQSEEPQNGESPERRGDSELSDRDTYNDARSVHVSVPSRPGSRRTPDFLINEDQEREFRKKHYISMPTEIPDRYRHVPGKANVHIDRSELDKKDVHKRGGAGDKEDRDSDIGGRGKQPLNLPERKREPDRKPDNDVRPGQSKGITSLANALNLNSNALDSDELLLLTLILLLAEEGADIGLIIALLYILV